MAPHGRSERRGRFAERQAQLRAWWGGTPLLLAFPGATPLVQRVRPLGGPPVLVISLPRSGSSWVADVLAAAPEAAYLREPLTQSWLADHAGPSVFSLDRCPDPLRYLAPLERALRGEPRFGPRILRDPAQWRLRERSRRRALIKEVNPLVLPSLLDRHPFRVIHLVRHPAAVAHSFHALGWLEKRLEARFTDAERDALRHRFDLEDFEDDWRRHGALQAVVEQLVRDALQGVPSRLVHYEDLCRDPESGFRELFAFLGFTWTEGVVTHLQRGSAPGSATGYAAGAFDLVRDARSMADAWRSHVAPGELERVRDAYLAYGGDCYSRDARTV